MVTYTIATVAVVNSNLTRQNRGFLAQSFSIANKAVTHLTISHATFLEVYGLEGDFQCFMRGSMHEAGTKCFNPRQLVLMDSVAKWFPLAQIHSGVGFSPPLTSVDLGRRMYNYHEPFPSV